MEQLQDLPFDRALQSDVYLTDGLEGQKERFKLELEKDIKNLEMLIESDPDMKNPETFEGDYLIEYVKKRD